MRVSATGNTGAESMMMTSYSPATWSSRCRKRLASNSVGFSAGLNAGRTSSSISAAKLTAATLRWVGFVRACGVEVAIVGSMPYSLASTGLRRSASMRRVRNCWRAKLSASAAETLDFPCAWPLEVTKITFGWASLTAKETAVRRYEEASIGRPRRPVEILGNSAISGNPASRVRSSAPRMRVSRASRSSRAP